MFLYWQTTWFLVLKTIFLNGFPVIPTNVTPVNPSVSVLGCKNLLFLLTFLPFNSVFYLKKKSTINQTFKITFSPITIHPLLPFLRRGFKQGCLLRELLKHTPHPLDTAGALEAKSFALATGRLSATISIDGGHALITKGVQPWGWEALFGCILGTDDPALLEQDSQLGDFCKGASEFCAR